MVQQCEVITENKETKWELTIANTGFDDTSFGTVFAKLRYRAFIGVRRIIDLPVYPIKYHPDGDKLLESLKA